MPQTVFDDYTPNSQSYVKDIWVSLHFEYEDYKYKASATNKSGSVINVSYEVLPEADIASDFNQTSDSLKDLKQMFDDYREELGGMRKLRPF